MRTVDIHEAKIHLSRLIERAPAGEPFIIAEAGRPLVKVVPIDKPDAGARRRLGFLAGEAEVPDDFGAIGADEIERMFRDAG